MSRSRSADNSGKNGHAVAQSDLLGLIGYNMKRAYMLFYQDLKGCLAEFGLRQRTFSVLSLVVENPNISQIEVARMLGIERSGTVVIVDELEERKLVVREKVPGDRRAYALAPTDQGVDLYRQALAGIMRHEEQVLAPLTKGERQTLLSLLARIHEIDTQGRTDAG